MASGIDDFLDAVALALTDGETGVKELLRDPRPTADGEPQKYKNVLVWHHGENDISEDIAKATAMCQGVFASIADMGGDNDPRDAANPVIEADVIIDLFVDPTKRPSKKRDLRMASQIRDDVMQTLHLNPALLSGQHHHFDTTVRGYEPVADEDYVVWRVRISRSIYLNTSKS